MKKLIPAICMLLISAMLLGTSTYAWFSMSNQVTATGMKVVAKADSGIVIKYTGDTSATFQTTANVNDSDANELYPSSTVNLTEWWSAKSSQKDDAEPHQDASKYTNVSSTNGYFKKYDFIIRSSADGVPVDNVKLAVNALTVTAATTVSESLSKTVRVGVKCGDTFYIYAPLADAAVTINPGYAYDDTAATKYDLVGEVSCTASNGDAFALTNNRIPATDTGITASVFVWFEGEDINCTSDNVKASCDDISVQVTFQTVDVTTAP